MTAIQQDFSLPSKAYSVIFLEAKIAILCKKGFEIMDLSKSESIDISHPITGNY